MSLKLFATLGLFFLALGSGCARYKVRTLVLHDKTIDTSVQEQKGIQLSVSSIHEEDLKNYFSPYKVLHLNIRNNSDVAYHITSESISLPVESQQHLRNVQPWVYTRDLLPSIASIFAGVMFWWEICLPLSGILCLLALQNAGYKNDTSIRGMHQYVLFAGDSVAILPKKSCSIVIFVPKDAYKVPFVVGLTAGDGARVDFDVLITSKVVHGYKVV